MHCPRLVPAALSLCALLLAGPAAAHAAGPPRALTLDRGWQVRDEAGDPSKPQPPPPEESAPGGAQPEGPVTPPTSGGDSFEWRAARVPGVFDTRALASLYPGEVKRYRLAFRAPRTPRGFGWMLVFERVGRRAGVILNGRRIGSGGDGYTRFAVEARGLRPGRRNVLEVKVDNRKDPRLREGWWNWGGLIRPVRLVPVGRAHLHDLGTMSRVRCRGHARRCRAELLIDATLARRGARSIDPRLEVELRSPRGRVTRATFELGPLAARRRRVQLSLPVPRPQLWAPERPHLYRARLTLRDRGGVQQVERRWVGLRSVEVKRGWLFLNNRRVQLRGASIHEDMPGSGAALTPADMNRFVADLKELGANVTRSHYALDERLLRRLDRAGIMVWNQAPIWQRDRGGVLLRWPEQRRRAWQTVKRTVIAARSHPSVITHSVANELWSRPDERPNITQAYLVKAQEDARDLDPTLPISVDVNGRPGHPEQFTYHRFDMLGINQYFGWYRWVENFDELPLYLAEMHDNYPQLALVMTEFGAEARPELAGASPELKGSYGFQTFHLERTLDVVDSLPFLSGTIYWTLREFEIFPGWRGGAGRRPPELRPNTRHHKGLLTYEGEKKPAWHLARERFRAVPLYP